MTAPDPRLGAYHPANRQDATDDLIRMLTESADIPGNVRLPREAVNMLLAELRKAQDKLGDLRDGVIREIAEVAADPFSDDQFTNGWKMALELIRDRLIRAAVADATGGERG